MHPCQLTRVIELQAGIRLPLGGIVGSASFRSGPRSMKVSRTSGWTLWYWSMISDIMPIF